ncbi:histidine kinase dimerization/phospho-acceptor domain-containing protein [Pengzhenrongella sp.]|uniref:histidine kinase dimerization/phospho-acceptor domain-containing protein n=1 Tax=Pengzhenrongella sp. TaxID=2888820 RepID=UPI0039C94F5E
MGTSCATTRAAPPSSSWAELRSPLSVVDQFASLLLDDVAGPLSQDQRDFLSVLTRNVSELTVMIDDLLQVTHADHGRVLVELAPLSICRDISAATWSGGTGARSGRRAGSGPARRSPSRSRSSTTPSGRTTRPISAGPRADWGRKCP